MVVKEEGPLPKRLLADIDISMLPSPGPDLLEHGSRLTDGTVQIPFMQDDVEIVRE